jgi:hypothetical protein
LCFNVSNLNEEQSFCLKFCDLNAKINSLSGCVDLLVESKKMPISRIKLGHFRAAPNRVFTKHVEFENGEFKKAKTKQIFEW